MSGTDSDYSIDWLSSDYEDDSESERESDSDGKTRESRPASSPPPPTAPQPGRADGAWQARARDGSPPGCAVKWEPAAELCKRQQGERTNPPHTLKRPCDAAEEEEQEQRGERPPPSKPATEADLAFRRKCMELQCYIPSLSSIQIRLRSGRYRERLGSLQESMAMDRILKIKGVLQNPDMGGKYMSTILKMEEMLKSWFPRVKPHEQPDQSDATQAEEAVAAKRLKLSPESTYPAVAATAASHPPTIIKAVRVTDITPPACYSASNLKWFHIEPICSPMAENLLTQRNRDLTQDNSVSSSTDNGHAETEPLARGPPPLPKINAPCLERLLKATESIIGHKGAGGLMDNSWS